MYTGGMAEFDDLLSQLRAWEPGENAARPEPTLYDGLASEYRAIVDQRDGASVILSQRDEIIANHEKELSRLRGENYELARSLGFNTKEETNDVPSERPKGIAGLFERKSK